MRSVHGMAAVFLQEDDMRIVKMAPAKINLYLYLPGRREDGYHLIDSCMQTLALYDRITVDVKTKKEGGTGRVEIKTDAGYLNSDPAKNTAYRAAVLFQQKMEDQNCDISIDLEKHIPAQAGLGGGSTDGAAVLRALFELFPGTVDEEELIAMAVKIGADVPFFLKGGTVRCSGIGEVMQEALPLQGLPVLLMKPLQGVSTQACYRRFDEEGRATVLSDEKHAMLEEFLFPEETVSPIDRVKKVCRIWTNDLQAAALTEVPEIGRAFPLMQAYGAFYTAMSGSGSAVFGIFENEEVIRDLLASEACRQLEEDGWSAYPVTTI